jgi:hypothetical protein
MKSVCFALIALLAACDTSLSTAPPSEPMPGPTTPREDTPPNPSPAPATPSGYVYLVAQEGVGVVQGNGLRDLGLGNHLHLGRDGEAYAAAHGRLVRIEGAATTPLPAPEGTAESLSVDAEGALWLVTLGGGFFRLPRGATAWQQVEPTPRGAAKAVVVDGEGVLWLATTHGLYRRDGERWERDRRPGADIRGLRRALDGSLLVVHPRGVLRRIASEWVEVDTHRVPFDQFSASMNADGVVAVIATNLFVGHEGRTTLELEPATVAPGATQFLDASVDAEGRVWVSTNNGLALLDGLGQRRAFWPPGSLRGVVATPTRLLAVGSPPLPATSDPVRGTVQGRVVGAGPGARVELCEGPRIAQFDNETPCEGRPLRAQTTTTSEGRFQFVGVPRWVYGFAVLHGGQWRVAGIIHPLGGEPCCVELSPGGTLTAPDIML